MNRGKGTYGRMALVAFFCLWAYAARAAQDAPGGDVFARLAADFRQTVKANLPRLDACAPGGKKTRVGVLPFDPARAPLPEAALRRIYNDMLAQLTARPPGCVEFLDARSMRAILRHLQQTGAYDRKGMSAIKALRGANADADLLLVGQITSANGRFYLDYRLIGRKTGKLLARLRARELPNAHVEVTSADSALPVSEATRQAARELIAQAPRMTALAVDGIYFQDTRQQTSGGRYLRDKLRDRLVRVYANTLSGKALRLVSKGARAEDDGIYVLSGHYRIMGGDAVDLSVTLRNASGMTASWSGLARIYGLEGLRWRPEEEAGTQTAAARPDEASGPGNPFGFELISDHGVEAIYAPGEELRLKMRLERTAYVYCYYTGVRGETAALIPNPRWIRKSGRKSFRVRKYVMTALPEPGRDGFILRVSRRATKGEALVRCYAASRDITAELPAQLRGAGDGLAPPELAARMNTVFQALKGVTLATAKLKIRITGTRKAE